MNVTSHSFSIVMAVAMHLTQYYGPPQYNW